MTRLSLLAAVVLSLSAASCSQPKSPAEQQIAEKLYMPNGLYHVADLQARPAVAAALARLKAANVCDLYFRVRIHKMHDNIMRAQLCGAPTDGRTPEERGKYNFPEARVLHPDYPNVPRFAVFTAADGAQFLIADGKNGSVGADDMEKVVVTVIDNALAALPDLMTKAQAAAQAAQAQHQAVEDGQRKAQESFK